MIWLYVPSKECGHITTSIVGKLGLGTLGWCDSDSAHVNAHFFTVRWLLVSVLFFLHPTWQDVPTWLSALLSWVETVETVAALYIYCPRLEFPIYILIQWFKHRNSIAQLKKIDGDRWPCLLYRLFTSYVAAFTRNSGFWSIPIPSVRSIMYGRLSCLYISPKKTETQSLQYSTWHLWVRMISACFSSFETTWSIFFHDCHGLFCQVLTDKEAFQAQFFCVSGCWRKKWLWQFISTLD